MVIRCLRHNRPSMNIYGMKKFLHHWCAVWDNFGKEMGWSLSLLRFPRIGQIGGHELDYRGPDNGKTKEVNFYMYEGFFFLGFSFWRGYLLSHQIYISDVYDLSVYSSFSLCLYEHIYKPTPSHEHEFIKIDGHNFCKLSHDHWKLNKRIEFINTLHVGPSCQVIQLL